MQPDLAETFPKRLQGYSGRGILPDGIVLKGCVRPLLNIQKEYEKMNRLLIAAAPCVVLFAASMATAQIGPNLLNNPGFEDPLGFDFSNPTNWNGFFGGQAGTFLQSFNDTGATPRSGNNALVTTIRGVPGVTNGFDGFTGQVQTVFGVTPGLVYEFSVWARTNPRVLDGVEYRIEWIDAGNNEVGRLNTVLNNSLTSDYQRFSFTDTAPAGAAAAKLVLAVQSFFHTGDIADTSVAWDDASFNTIPGPGACAILALGGLFAGRRRR